jgi:excisionase family DNA binding protein
MSLEEPPKTVPEACRDWLGGKIGKRSLYIAIHEGRLKAAKPKGGQSWLVEKVDVVAWWESEKCRERGNPQDLSSSVHHPGSKCISSATERSASALASIEKTKKELAERFKTTSHKDGKHPKGT